MKAPGDTTAVGLPIISLFSGPGGLDLGFEEAGFCPRLALDIDRAAVKTYNANRPNSRRVARLVDLSKAKPTSILKRWEKAVGPKVKPVGAIGGPPCRAFSISNVNKVIDDPREELPLRYAQILHSLNERYDIDFFLFENVAGLAHRRHAISLEQFVLQFKEAGFGVKKFFLDAARFGVPQHRNRMFIVGFNSKRYDADEFNPPVGRKQVRTVRQTIGKLERPLYFTRDAKPADFGLHPNHWCMRPRSDKFGNGALKPGEMRGRSFRRLNWDEPSWTVAYGHREVHVHPSGERRLSVFEAMLLQGFPPGYELRGTLSDQIRQVSDAVPPPVARALADSIRRFLAESSQEDRSTGAGSVGVRAS
jgi:DNA (cytosine-5)-methyltransferase 1